MKQIDHDMTLFDAASIKEVSDGTEDVLALDSLLCVKTPGECTCFHAAVYFDHASLIPLLSRRGGDVNAGDKDGWSPLHEAAASGRRDCAKELIINGANINAQALVNDHDYTPLCVAILAFEYDMVKFLLERGADPRILDGRGFRQTAAHVAARISDDGSALRILLQKDHHLAKSPDTLRQTPLHEAAWFARLGPMKALIDCGANVNAQDQKGSTALHIVWFKMHEFYRMGLEPRDVIAQLAYKEFYDCREFLIKSGADLTLPDSSGNTAAEDGFLSYILAQVHHKFALKRRRRGTALHTWQTAKTNCPKAWTVLRYALILLHSEC